MATKEKTPLDDGPWDRLQVNAFVRQATNEWGAAWRLLGERFQRALITERAFYIAASQASGTVETEAMTWLVQAMLFSLRLEP